ncbi:MAG: hypothetical protein J2P52_03120 [Blastocatellia bacterium]|nr:hypothetical protein [Blastocatellia bacterium]
MTNNNYTPPADLGRVQNISIGVGLIGVLLWIISVFAIGGGKDTFFHSYLVAFIFWISAALGCLGFLMIHYLTGANWGLLIRRQLEAGAHTLWLMFILFLPIATVGLKSLYVWARGAGAAKTEEAARLITHKSAWLNQPAFLIRGVIYFAIWIGLAACLRKWSRQQDENRDMGALQRAQNLSGPGFVIYALAVTFAGVDWVMSLDVEWYSTIFGLVFLIGQGVLALSLLITIGVYLSGRDPMARVYQPKHFHDQGKLLLTVIMVWAYFSFSQLLIIWSGNLPEETPWYLQRFSGQWRWMGVGLILLNFALPFLLLLSRDLKHNRRRLMGVAWLLIAMRFVDMLWLIAPAFEGEHAVEAARNGLSVASYFNYAAAVIGLGGLWFGWFFYQLRQRALVPCNDPQLQEVLVRSEHVLSFEGY